MSQKRVETRVLATGIYERGIKWAMGVKLAIEAGTRKIGIEVSKGKIAVTKKAIAEFKRLVYD